MPQMLVPGGKETGGVVGVCTDWQFTGVGVGDKATNVAVGEGGSDVTVVVAAIEVAPHPVKRISPSQIPICNTCCLALFCA